MWTRWTGRFRPDDRAVAAGFVVAAAVEALVRYHDQPVQLGINLPGALLWTFLLARRSRPLLVVSAVAGLGITGSLLQAGLVPGESTDSVVAVMALLVVTYSLGAYGSRRDLLIGAPLTVLLVLGIDVLEPSNEPLDKALPFAVCFVVVAPVAAGRLVRARNALIARLRAQAAELEAHRAEQVAAELARDRVRVGERLHARLVTGLRELDRRVGRPAFDAAAVAGIEQAARELLGHTRQAVVALVDSPDAPPVAVDTGPARPAEAAAQPWTALAAAALCAGLIVELPALPLQVPAPVGVLACCLLVVPLALVWASPLVLTGALWALAGLFDAFVASLTSSTAAIGLPFVAPFAVAALSSRPRAVLGLALCGAGEAAVFGRSGVAAALIVSVASWLAGAVLRERTQLVARLRRNAGLLDEQRAAIGQRAVLQERARIARELHDALGHSLTVVALQAGAARRMWSTDPERATAIVRTLAAVTRDGLSELQAGLDRSPRGDLGSLDTLVARARAAGLVVVTQLDDVDPLLDADVRAVLYRAVQESLTNVLKHAPGAVARVSVRDRGGEVELVVTNSRPPVPPGAAGSGRGLAGMRARVTACGGRLEFGGDGAGGFRVRVALPCALVRS